MSVFDDSYISDMVTEDRKQEKEIMRIDTEEFEEPKRSKAVINSDSRLAPRGKVDERDDLNFWSWMEETQEKQFGNLKITLLLAALFSVVLSIVTSFGLLNINMFVVLATMIGQDILSRSKLSNLAFFKYALGSLILINLLWLIFLSSVQN